MQEIPKPNNNTLREIRKGKLRNPIFADPVM
jgi:hypothetical protein